MTRIDIKKFLPFLNWFPMDGFTIRTDLIAGITVALVLIPQSMAYAQLAGLPPYYGLYAAFLPGAVAALFGSSKQLATGPVAVVSLLTASSLMPFAAIGSEPFIGLAIMMTLMVGVIQLSLGLLKLGVVVSFLSHPVIIGFTNAAALIIGLSQLSKIFGVTMGRSESFMNDIWGVIQQIHLLHLPTLLFGMGAFAIMYSLKKYYPKIPNVLVAVAVTILLSWSMDFQGSGGKVVGTIPEGLPKVAIPTLDLDIMAQLFVSALVIAMVGFMEAISIAKAMAAKTKDRVNPNQELIGQGLANIVGSFAQSYPTSGSFSRSAVNLGAGALTGMSSLFTALIVLITLLFLTPLLYHLPQAVLAAVIMMAVIGLINFKAIAEAWRAQKHDGIASIVTFLCTLGFAPHLDKGILIGASLAIFLFLFRMMQPRVAVLGRYQDGTLRDITVHPTLPTDNRIILIRFDGQLFFANVTYFEDSVLRALSDKPDAQYILVIGNGINQLDASGEEVMRHLVERLGENKITVMFAGFKKQVLDVMRRTGFFEQMDGDKTIHATSDQALLHIYKELGIERDDSQEGEYCPLYPHHYRPLTERIAQT